MKKQIVSMLALNKLGHFQTWSKCLSLVSGLCVILKKFILYIIEL